MSEGKLYAVKNEDGKYWDFNGNRNFGRVENNHSTAIASKKLATIISNLNGGHVVTFVQEPEKVTVSTNEAKAIESLLNANAYIETLDPFRYLFTSRNREDIKRLIKAFKNGYTVAKEKKYKVRVPKTQTSYYYKGSDGRVHASDTSGGLDNQFSDYELQQYGLDSERFTKEEVTDDGIR